MFHLQVGWAPGDKELVVKNCQSLWGQRTVDPPPPGDKEIRNGLWQHSSDNSNLTYSSQLKSVAEGLYWRQTSFLFRLTVSWCSESFTMQCRDKVHKEAHSFSASLSKWAVANVSLPQRLMLRFSCSKTKSGSCKINDVCNPRKKREVIFWQETWYNIANYLP